MSRGPRFEREFKIEVAKQVAQGKRTVHSMANEIGVHENTIYKWVQQYAEDPEQAFPGTGHMKAEQDELQRAQRRIKELEEDIEILKKAAAYFAKNGR